MNITYTSAFESTGIGSTYSSAFKTSGIGLCKALTKSACISLSITAVCKNAGKKTLGRDDFFVVKVITLGYNQFCS